jgi:uncharacterized membrane protein
MPKLTLINRLPLILTLAFITGCSSCTFELRSEVTNFTRNQGGSGAQHVFVDREAGFTDDVVLAVTGAPSGVTATYEPPAIAGDVGIVHLAIDETAATGDTTLTVVGTAPGGQTDSVEIPLSILGADTEDFGVDASPLSSAVAAGGSAEIEVDLQWHGPFADDVDLECQGLPADVTCSFADNPVPNGQDFTTLTIDAASTAVDGEYAVVINAEAGTQAKATAILLLVGDGAAGDDDDSAGDDDDSAGDDDDSAGDDDDSAGDDDDSAGDDDDSAGDDDDSAATGSFAVRSEVTNFSINQTMAGSMTVYVDRSGGHDAPVTLSASADTGLTVSFEEAAPIGGAAVLILEVDSSGATGNSTIAVTGDDGASTSSANFPVTVNSATFPDYVLKVNTHSQELVAGGSDGFANIEVQWGGSFSEDVVLTCDAPTEITCVLGMGTVSHPNTDSAVTLTVAASAASGVYPIQVEGLGDSISKLVSFQVVVP